jgi:hypothetical protein
MPNHEEDKGHSGGELYGVFLHGKWVTHSPVFTEKQAAESWLMKRKPPDGYKGAVVKSLRAEARELRKRAARVLEEATQESGNLLATGHSDDDLYCVFRKGKLVADAPVFTEQQTAQIWLLMQKRMTQDGYKGLVVKSLKAETKERRKKAARVLVQSGSRSIYLHLRNSSTQCRCRCREQTLAASSWRGRKPPKGRIAHLGGRKTPLWCPVVCRGWERGVECSKSAS